MSLKPPAADQPRWLRRLTRAVDLATTMSAYRHLRSARQVARSADIARDRDTALIKAADHCMHRGLCYEGTLRFTQHVFELDRDTTLQILATATNSAMAIKIAGDPTLPASAAEELKVSASVTVRENLAGNHAVPENALAALLKDPESSVRQRAYWNESRLISEQR